MNEMTYTLKNGLVYYHKSLKQLDIVIKGNKIYKIGNNLQIGKIIDCTSLVVAPSFIDPHVHLREPGYSYKETILSGTNAALRGGYTKIFLMPNVNPPINCLNNLLTLQNIIKKDSKIDCYILGSITKGRKGDGSLSNMEEMAPYVVGYSDDGCGVQKASLMYEACLKAKELNKAILAHVEENSLLYDGYIYQGEYAKKHNHKGILPIVETSQLARDLTIANYTQTHYHMCHVSCKDSIDLIRFYKYLGLNVTVEVTPHHLLLTEEDLKEDGCYKMNPPLGSKYDQQALINALVDGTIDCIATDHAPHSFDEKNKGLEKSSFGIVGLETSFPLLYTNFVMNNIISLEKLLDLMSENVSNIFMIPSNKIEEGNECNIVLLDLNHEYEICSEKFASKGKSTPFDHINVYGRVVKTIYKGDIIYEL